MVKLPIENEFMKCLYFAGLNTYPSTLPYPTLPYLVVCTVYTSLVNAIFRNQED